VLVVAPSLDTTPLTADSAAREEFLRRLAHAQDLPVIARPASLATAPAADAWAAWFLQHWGE
jgi:hypothetical protein